MKRSLTRLRAWLFLAAIATAVVFVRTFDHEERTNHLIRTEEDR